MNKEIFRDIEDYEGYQISNLGRVKSFKNGSHGLKNEGRILKQWKNSNGYLTICLRKDGKLKNIKIAHLVAQAFVPNPENKPEVNHKNGIKTDNMAVNLEHCTRSENHIHAFETGLRTAQQGEKHGRSKLNEMQVRVIKHLKHINCKITLKEIARVFKVDPSLISRIHLGKIWQHIII